MSLKDARKVHCSNCGDVRNCEVLHKYEERSGDEDFQFHTDWYLLRCRGCEYVFMQTVATNSEEYYNYEEPDGSPATHHIETISFWPPVLRRPSPAWVMELADDRKEYSLLRKLIEELYRSLNSDNLILSAIGIRTCFDLVAQILGIDAELSFASKVDELVKRSTISASERDNLVLLVEVGNASAHRSWIPAVKELNLIVQILEHYVETLVVFPLRAKALREEAVKAKAGVPSRKPR